MILKQTSLATVPSGSTCHAKELVFSCGRCWGCLVFLGLPSRAAFCPGWPGEAPIGLALELGGSSRQEGGNIYMALEGRTAPFAADTAVPSCTDSHVLPQRPLSMPTPSSHVEPLRQQAADRCLHSPQSGFVPAYTTPVSYDVLV